MAELAEGSRIIIPFKPTLYHMALSKLAIKLHNEFGLEIILKTFTEMEAGTLPESIESRKEMCPILRETVKANLLRIPVNFRREVLAVIEKIEIEISNWMQEHDIEGIKNPKLLIWRCDGTVYRSQTAREICSNQNVPLTARFETACMYCLVDEVKTLWTHLDENVKLKRYKRFQNSANVLVPFWVKLLQDGAENRWSTTVTRYILIRAFTKPRNLLPSSLFRALTTEERRYFLPRLGNICNSDSLRFCFYAMTNEEQEEAITFWAESVMELHMSWPLTSTFLEIAEKVFKSLHPFEFCCLLKTLLNRKDRSYFNFESLAIEFWNRSPDKLKVSAMDSSNFQIISEFIQTIKKK